MADNKNLEFIQMYTVKGLSPLQLDIGIGQIYVKDFARIGLYGDKHFLYYSKNGLGRALFEKDEMEKTAKVGEEYFSDPKKFNDFVKQTTDLIEKTKQFITKFEKLDLEKLDYPTLRDLAIERIGIEEDCFTYYDATEPQLTSKIEEKLNFYLIKVISSDKYNDYSAKLMLTEEPNTLSREELDWLEIVKLGKSLGIENVDENEKVPDELCQKIEDHFHKFEALTLGDASWFPDITYFYNKYREDIKKSNEEITKRIQEVTGYPQKVATDKQQIISETKISPDMIHLCKVLSEIGHLRLGLRIDAWTLIVYFGTLLDKELMNRLGVSYEDLHSKTRAEYEEFLKSQIGSDHLSSAVQNGPLSFSKDYLYYIDDGQIKLLYGDEAAKTFNELVTQEDFSQLTEVKGNTAMTGKSQGKVCIYSWGDNLEEKLKEMDERKILITGMTRPQLMPLIYKSSAIVTDQGGVTCHAAIVSRELGIPCVIGTKNATKVFKPGDIVEVDADTGIVRKI